ncbi:MAG: hypothetical protein V2G50_02450 [bacterium JZ-2024 1]
MVLFAITTGLTAGCRQATPGGIVVYINDAPVTLAELQATPEFYDFLEDYIALKMIQVAADTQQIKPTREAVEALEKQEITERWGGDTGAMEQWLSERGLTRDDFRQFVIRKLRREMLIAKHLEPGDEEVRQTFEARKQYWREYYAQVFQMPKDKIPDEMILAQIKKNLMFLRKTNPAETRKILETYRGWATKVVYPKARPARETRNTKRERDP